MKRKFLFVTIETTVKIVQEIFTDFSLSDNINAG